MSVNINIDRNKKVNIYLQLYRQLKNQILEKKIGSHSQLPTIREMADQLSINPATVVKAYNLLEMEELIYKKVGSGSFVSPGGERYAFGNTMSQREGYDSFEYGQIEVNADINFASATISPDLFPLTDFKRLANNVLERDGGQNFVYQKSQGYYPLRESLAHDMLLDKIRVDANEIVILNGAQQGIDVMAKVLLDMSATVLLAEYSYYGAITAFKSRGAKIKTISVVSDGIDLDKLKELLDKNDVSLLYMISNYQNPTGVSWSDDKKEELLAMAEHYKFYIIEDDCLSDLYYDEEKPVILKSLDLNNRVIYIKSYSKLFMPGLRLGFMVVPKKLQPAILAAKYATDISGNGFNQRILDLYLREGIMQRHLQKMRLVFKRRFHLMKEKLRYFHPDISLIHGPRGGFYFWLSLPESLDSEHFYLQAVKKGVSILPGRVFRADNYSTPCFRLSFASANEKEVKLGMDTLARLSREFIEGDSKGQDFMPLL